MNIIKAEKIFFFFFFFPRKPGSERGSSHICYEQNQSRYPCVNQAAMAEWLRRWTWNPMGSSRAGSNPARSVLTFFLFFLCFEFLSLFLLFNVLICYGGSVSGDTFWAALEIYWEIEFYKEICFCFSIVCTLSRVIVTPLYAFNNLITANLLPSANTKRHRWDSNPGSPVY